jgi:hypothetical protein
MNTASIYDTDMSLFTVQYDEAFSVVCIRFEVYLFRCSIMEEFFFRLKKLNAVSCNFL